MASKLSVYNGALLAIGERKLGSLTEDRASRRRLDTVFDGDTGIVYCLQQSMWNFAMNTVELTFSPSVTPAFGFRYAFDKPTDWVRTALVSDDEQFCNKRFQFEDQAAYWYADSDPIYVKYVSKDTQFGLDLSLWPANFTNYVEHYFASKIVKATTNSTTDSEALEAKVERLLRRARGTDAMDESPKFIPPGTWSQARRGGGGRGDGGNTGSLIG